MSTNREQWLDIAKGFAILLVVLGHVLIGFLTAGMYPQFKEGLNYIIYTIYSFHMPLFFAISGYLYGRYEERATPEKAKEVLLKKLIRLGIPFVLFSWIQGLLHLVLNHYTNRYFDPFRFIKMYASPFDQFWYIYALLAIFILIARLEIAIHKDMLIFGILIVLKCLPSIFNVHVPLPFLEWFMAYGLYFFAGTLIARHAPQTLTHPLILAMGSLIYIPLNLLFYNHSTLEAVKGNMAPISATLASILLAFSGILLTFFIIQKLLLAFRWSNVIFTWLGLFSFEIYLLHTMPSAAIRIVLQKLLHTDNFALHLGAAMAVGVLFPVLVGWWARHNKSIDFMFYPGKYIKWNKPAKTESALPA